MAWVRVHKWAIALFLVCTVVYLYILLAYHLDGRLFALPVAVIVLYYVKFANEGESDFYKSVAGAWGWDYFPALLPKDFPSSFLVHGKKGVALHVLRSKSLPRVEIATLFYELGPGQATQQFKKTVVRVDLSYPVVGLVLIDDDISLGVQLLSWRPDVECLKVDVLNGINRKLYVERKLEIEALQVFSDARLAQVAAATQGYTVEFSETDVYVYSSHVVQDSGDFKELLEISQLVLDELVPKLAQISSSTRAMQEAKADKGV
jgi:hypothetical protein